MPALVIDDHSDQGVWVPLSRRLQESREGVQVVPFAGSGGRRDEIHALTPHPLGGVVCCGFTHTDRGGKFDFLTLRADRGGNVLWVRTWGPVRSGGDAVYRAGHLSEVFWRSDIAEAEAVAVDAGGDIFVAGSSTFSTVPRLMEQHRDYGVAVVSYDAQGRPRYSSRIPDATAGKVFLSAADGGLLAVGTSQGYERARRQSRNDLYYAQVALLRTRDGKVLGKRPFGTGTALKALRAMHDGTLVAVIAEGQGGLDFAQYQYSPGGPSAVSSWRVLVMDGRLNVTRTWQLDKSAKRLRGSAHILGSGDVLTIDGMPDGSDLLRRWRKKSPVWQAPLPGSRITYVNPARPDTPSYYLHDRINAEMAVQGSRLFVQGGPASTATGPYRSAVEGYSLETGRMEQRWERGDRVPRVLQALAADSERVWLGGRVGDDANSASVDAWFGWLS